jgi:hypothetical protein
MKVQRQVTEEQRLLNDRFYRRTEARQHRCQPSTMTGIPKLKLYQSYLVRL